MTTSCSNQRSAFLQEIANRANRFTGDRFLSVHYYRIRKRLAVPLPITDSASQKHSVRAFSSPYPWAIWLRWALENRMVVLGEYVDQTDDAAARSAIEADLFALARWRSYREFARPDLAYAHAVRVLWVAITRWKWIDDILQLALRDALHRAVEDALPLSDQLHGQFDSLQTLLATKDPHQHLHNIPVIGTIALALAAKVVGHPASVRLDERVTMLFTAVLELRQKGFTEGVSYDGYALNFMADWLTTLDAAARSSVLSHPSFHSLVEQSLELSVPGNVMATAPLGDVEPLEMPFVWSALAKLQTLQSNPRVASALSQCELSLLRSDALSALACLPDQEQNAPAVHSPAILNYALVLRTGYANDDVAVAMGLSTSPMGHIQCDNGSLVLGTRRRWWLDDPGYQQYLETTERRFTVGATAHNAPVVNGYAQVHKQPVLEAVNRLEGSPDVQFALVNLTACYPAEASVRRVCRAVWLVGDKHLVVRDEIVATASTSITYHWHGHPSLYWCLQDGAATMVSEDDPDRCLQIYSPQIVLHPADLQRLPGSRGQQTLSVTIFSTVERIVWWVFSFEMERPSFHLSKKAFSIGNQEVPIGEKLLMPLQPLSRCAPLVVTAAREGNEVRGQCVVGEEHFSGELEYAFYLMVGGKKALVQWYTPDPKVCFTVPSDTGQQKLELLGFVRERLNPEKKVMKISEVSEASS